ncbi:MAG: PIN domain-containing protein [Rhodopirellula sp.]|nr:PIN domain-containing protein [Rhodopirellula sp.]
MNAIDTNVLVYSFDADDPVRQQQAIELIDQLSENSEDTILPWQVIVECLACLRRWVDRGRLSASDVDQHMADVSILFPVAMPSMNMIPRSLGLTSRHSLSHWDSLLIAACIEANVDTLYSEDLGEGEQYDTVTVVNPFS